MKWFQIAKIALRVLEVFVPGVRGLAPVLEKSIDEAQKLHGDENPKAKRELVMQRVVADGGDRLLAERVFDTADAMHAVQKAV